MGLFERKRFVWNEPWFFLQRIRPAKAWIHFSLFLLVIAAGMGVALYFALPAKGPLGLLQSAAMSVGFAALVWWVLDGTNTRRQAVLFGDSIVVGCDMGKYSHATTYKLSNIPATAIVLPEESKWPEPALFFIYEGEEQAIGIDRKASLKRLAQAIHDAGVFVRLEGWEPNQENELAKAFSWRAEPQEVVEKARMETLPPGTPSLLTPGGILVAIVRQSWAIVLWLAITAGAVYYGYTHWRSLGIVEVVLLIGIPIGAMWLAGEITERYATASTSRSLNRMARGQLRKRQGVEVDPDAADLIPVEVFVREQFDKSIQKMHELGYLQADPAGRRMRFEGKKVRWSIPAGSIKSLALEEVQMGTPGQSATGMLHYYVVVRFAGEEEHEFGFRNSERDFGSYDDVKRAEGGIRVFEAFESLLPATSKC